MPDLQKNYSTELEKLQTRVKKCSIEALDSIEFFLKEANAYTEGIPIDIEKEVRWEIDKFKRNCPCTKPKTEKNRLFGIM